MSCGLRFCEFRLVPHPQQNHRLWMLTSSLVPNAPPSQLAVATRCPRAKKRPSARGGQAAGAMQVSLEGNAGNFQAASTHVKPWCSSGPKIPPRLVQWCSQVFQLGCNARLSACCLTAPNAPSARVYIHGNAPAIRSDSSERIGPPTTFNYRDVAIAAIADNSPCLIAG
jgi:hypothetical protein